MRAVICGLFIAAGATSPVFAGDLKDACVAKGQSAAICTCIETEAAKVAAPPVIEYMAIQMRTGEPPINLMLNSGMDVGVFGDQIKAMSDQWNAVCY